MPPKVAVAPQISPLWGSPVTLVFITYILITFIILIRPELNQFEEIGNSFPHLADGTNVTKQH